jgi:hypothetical protein
MRQSTEEQKRNKLFSVTFILLLFFIHSGCMDPTEYKPDEPPEKSEPPDPPIILLPESDTVFRCYQNHVVVCDWTLIEGAQAYEMQIDTISNFSSSYPHGASPPTPVLLSVYPPMTTYFLRARAYSSSWIWYTDWSDTRRFYLIPTSDTIIHDTT